MTKNEINIKVDKLKNELFSLRFKAASGQLEQPHKIKETKREIARLLTKFNSIKEDTK